MRAEIIATGTEILLGQIVDTNTSFLADQLALLGVDLYYTCSVGDNYERLLGTLRQSWQKSELILTTGGLGPTEGDITREAIAGLLNERPEVDKSLKQSLVNYFNQRGLEMPLSNLKQATLIPSARTISNPQGTAPGWWVEKDGRIIIAMPGPPHEMQFMWRNEIFHRLQQRTNAIIVSRMIKIFDLSEAKIDELMTPLLSSPNPTLATYAKPDGIHLRITAKATKYQEAQEMISRREADVRSLIGDYIWGVDDETPENVVGRLLATKGLSLAIAECFTGGLLTHIVASDPQSKSYFKGGITVSSDEVKVFLGLEPGLATSGDSAQVSTAMASLARRTFNADIGIGIDGHADAADEVEMSKVFIAIDSEPTHQCIVQSYSGRYYYLKRRAIYQALFNLRRLLTTL